jgi:hypothetical protein
MIRINNNTDFPGLVINQTSEIVIVLAYPVPLPQLRAWVKELGIVASAILTIHPQPIQGNTAKLRDIRQGWVRVQNEIAALCPQVNRVLLMCDTKVMRVVLGMSVTPAREEIAPDIGKCWGNLFSVELAPSVYCADPVHCVIVPIWELEECQKVHVQKWAKRCCARLLRLEKPNEPLPYTKGIPSWVTTVN